MTAIVNRRSDVISRGLASFRLNMRGRGPEHKNSPHYRPEIECEGRGWGNICLIREILEGIVCWYIYTLQPPGVGYIAIRSTIFLNASTLFRGSSHLYTHTVINKASNGFIIHFLEIYWNDFFIVFYLIWICSELVWEGMILFHIAIVNS